MNERVYYYNLVVNIKKKDFLKTRVLSIIHIILLYIIEVARIFYFRYYIHILYYVMQKVENN